MDYNLLVCASTKDWMAIDVNSDGDCDRISFDGNEMVEVLSIESLDYVCHQILDYYNIENFDDIALNIKVVVIGEYSDLITELFMRMKNVKEINIIDAKNVIPILVLKSCVVKQDSVIDIKCMDQDYTMQVDSNLIVSFSSDKAGETIVVEPDHFSILFQFDCNNLISDEKELKMLETKYAKDIEEKQKEMEKQKKSYSELLEKYKKLEKSNLDLQKVIADQNTRFNDKRSIIQFTTNQFMTDSQKAAAGLTRFFESINNAIVDINAKYVCKILKADGDIVKKGTHLLEVMERSGLNGDDRETGRKCIIKANRDGRVFYLVKDKESIKDKTDVAVLSDPEDKRSDLMKWYKEMR